MMRPDLVVEEPPTVSDARPFNGLTLVRFDGGLHDAANATRPRLRVRHAAKVTGRMTVAILAAAVCLIMLFGVVINLLFATP